MVLEEDFVEHTEKLIQSFLSNAKKQPHDIMSQDHGGIIEHPNDFTVGYGLGYLEGIISNQFSNQYQRQMSKEENIEVRTLISAIVFEYKDLVFKGGV
ncbi:MAG: hypothetical protein J4F36_13170 [Nitrosopumilaceae archaeon]|nr:hypothetical protein [Nitrosopumilaceae archaeon]